MSPWRVTCARMLEHFEQHRALFRLLLQEELGSAKKSNKGSKHTMLRELMGRAERSPRSA